MVHHGDLLLTLRQFWRRHYHYGIGGYHFRRGIAAMAGQGFRLEPVQFYVDMLAAPWRQMPLPRAAAVAALVALSQVASTVGLARAWWSFHV